TEAPVDRACRQLRPRAQLGQLGGMADERADAVADEPDRGLEAGDQEPDRLREQLGRRQAVTGLLGADERGEQVVGEVPAPGGDQLLEVRRQRRARRLHLGQRLRGKELGGEAERCLRGPHREAVAILDRDAEHLADCGRFEKLMQYRYVRWHLIPFVLLLIPTLLVVATRLLQRDTWVLKLSESVVPLPTGLIHLA